MNPGATAAARILVVEDQEDVRRMLATALQMEGHVVDEAATAADGLICLEQSRYDLVLSDYRLYIEPGGLRTVKLSPEEAEEAETMKRRRRQYS